MASDLWLGILRRILPAIRLPVHIVTDIIVDNKINVIVAKAPVFLSALVDLAPKPAWFGFNFSGTLKVEECLLDCMEGKYDALAHRCAS